MRIALVCSEYPPCGAGIASYIQRLELELARRGHDVTILTRECRGSPEVGTTPNGASITRLKFLPVFPFGNMKMSKDAERILRNQRVDIVNVHYPAPITINTSHPSLLTIHNVLGGNRELIRRGEGLPSTVRIALPFLKAFEGSCINHYDCLTAVSEGVMTQAANDYPKAMKSSMGVVGNGIDVEVFEPVDASHRGSYVLYAGRLDKGKGIDLLIKAFAAIANEVPDLRLFVAGKGPLEKRCLSLSRELEISDKTQFLGWLTGQDYVDAVRRASVYVLPSSSEGLSTTLLEAASSGVAIIASDIPNNSSVITHLSNGLLFRNGDAADLTSKLRLLLHDNELKKNLERIGRQNCVNRYNWRNVVDNFERICESVIARRSGSQQMR